MDGAHFEKCEDKRVIVEFVDYGGTALCAFKDVRLATQFLDVPVKAYLANIKGITIVGVSNIFEFFSCICIFSKWS